MAEMQEQEAKPLEVKNVAPPGAKAATAEWIQRRNDDVSNFLNNPRTRSSLNDAASRQSKGESIAEHPDFKELIKHLRIGENLSDSSELICFLDKESASGESIDLFLIDKLTKNITRVSFNEAIFAGRPPNLREVTRENLYISEANRLAENTWSLVLRSAAKELDLNLSRGSESISIRSNGKSIFQLTQQEAANLQTIDVTVVPNDGAGPKRELQLTRSGKILANRIVDPLEDLNQLRMPKIPR